MKYLIYVVTGFTICAATIVFVRMMLDTLNNDPELNQLGGDALAILILLVGLCWGQYILLKKGLWDWVKRKDKKDIKQSMPGGRL